MKSILSTATVFVTVSLGLHSTSTHSAEAESVSAQAAITEYHAWRHDKAKQMFSDLLKDEQNKNVASYYLGRIALSSGDYTEANKYLEASVRTQPNSADELYWLATNCTLLLQRPSEAAKMGLLLCYQQNLEMALSIDPDHLPALTALHQYNVLAPPIAGGSPQRAAELLKKIEAVSMADADVGRLLEFNCKQEADKALALSKAMVAAYPTHAKALLAAGNAYSNNQRYPEALSALKSATAISITTSNAISIQAAYLEIGQIAWRTKSSIDQGAAALTKVVDRNIFPVNLNTNWAYLRLAQLSELRGDIAQQKKYMQLLDATGIERSAAVLKESARQ